MKKSVLLLVAGTLVAGMFGMLGAQAGHCGSGSGTSHDPFGSCENSDGDVKCAGTDAGGLFTVATATSGNGVEACNTGNGTLPAPAGRAAVWTDGSKVVVGVDGDRDQAGSSGWTRVDVTPGAAACKVHVRRGSGGTGARSYWAKANGDPSNADVADECAA